MELTRWLIAIMLIALPSGLVLRFAAKNGLLQQAIVAIALFVISATGFLFLDLPSLRGDETTYYQESLNILEYLKTGEAFVSLLPDSKKVLSAIAALFFFVSFSSPYLAVLFLTPVFALIPILLALATRNFYGSIQAMQAAGWITLVTPQVLLWSPWFRREVLAFFALSLAVYGASILLMRKWLLGTTFSGLSIVLMALTRIQLTWMLLFLFLTIGVILITDSSANKRQRLSALFAASAISSIFVFGQFVESRVSTSVLTIEVIVGNAETREEAIGSFSDSDQNLGVEKGDSITAAGNPGTLVVEDGGTFGLIVRNTAPSLLGPFPADWKNLSWVLAGVDGILIGAYFLIIFYSFFLPRVSRKPAIALLASTIPLIGANAISLSNYGLASRVRSNLVFMLIPVVAVTLSYLYVSWKSNRTTSKTKRSRPV